MAKDTKNNKDVKNKKHFFKDFKAELKKVIWPTPSQLANKTLAVIVTAAIVFVLDVIFDLLNQNGINRLKSNIKNKVVVENSVNNTEDSLENAIDVNAVEDESSVENAQ